MITWVMMRSAASGWVPRTSYEETPDRVLKRIGPLVDQDYDQAGDGGTVPVGVLLIYFSDAKAHPVVKEFMIERRRPVLVEVTGS